MRIRSNLSAILLAVAGLAACHGDSPTAPPRGAPLRFSGAASLSDTIEATFTQALLVEVHDTTGALAPAGTVVRFSAVPNGAPYSGYGYPYMGYEATVQALTSISFSEFATGLTDAAGKTGVLVRLGTKVGPARIVVTVPTLGLADTVRFTVKPGNATQALVSPADTALYVGKSYTLRGGLADRWGNPRPDPMTWTAVGSGITVTSAGVVTATAVGRYQLRADGVVGGVARSGTGWVSVVPTGRFAATSYEGVQELSVVAFDADGSNKTVLVTGLSDGGIGVHPAWIPGTSTVVYTAVSGGLQRLYAVGADGVPKLFFGTPPANTTHQAEPTPSADGNWLFFSIFDGQCSLSDYCIARSKIDGTGYELLMTTTSRQPAPSPDGSKVAYLAPNSFAIRVLDVATKTSSTWSVAGSTPSWSPDGTRIAYRTSTGGVGIVTPDGTVQAVAAPPFVNAVSGWSPDGKWLIVQSGGPVLLDPATGTTLPLGYAALGSAYPTSMK